jgi:ankyrin repeat protein
MEELIRECIAKKRARIIFVLLILIEHRANVNLLMNDGSTPLLLACQNGHVECARILLNADRNYDAATLLEHAREQMWSIDIRLLLMDHIAKQERENLDAAIANSISQF